MKIQAVCNNFYIRGKIDFPKNYSNNLFSTKTYLFKSVTKDLDKV